MAAGLRRATVRHAGAGQRRTVDAVLLPAPVDAIQDQARRALGDLDADIRVVVGSLVAPRPRLLVTWQDGPAVSTVLPRLEALAGRYHLDPTAVRGLTALPWMAVSDTIYRAFPDADWTWDDEPVLTRAAKAWLDGFTVPDPRDSVAVDRWLLLLAARGDDAGAPPLWGASRLLHTIRWLKRGGARCWDAVGDGPAPPVPVCSDPGWDAGLIERLRARTG